MKVVVRTLLYNSANGSDKVWGLASVLSDNESNEDKYPFRKPEPYPLSFWGKKSGPWSIKPIFTYDAYLKVDEKKRKGYKIISDSDLESKISESLSKLIVMKITSFPEDFIDFISKKEASK